MDTCTCTCVCQCVYSQCAVCTVHTWLPVLHSSLPPLMFPTVRSLVATAEWNLAYFFFSLLMRVIKGSASVRVGSFSPPKIISRQKFSLPRQFFPVSFFPFPASLFPAYIFPTYIFPAKYLFPSMMQYNYNFKITIFQIGSNFIIWKPIWHSVTPSRDIVNIF